MSSRRNDYFCDDILRSALQPKVSNVNTSYCQSENGEVLCSPSQSNNTGHETGFHIDRSSIKAVSKENQADELWSLEVSVYDQEVLEKGIIEQVDKALEEEKNKKLIELYDSQVISLREDIRATEERVKNDELSLQNLPIKDFVSNVNEALSLRREIDNGLSSIKTLKSKIEILEGQRKLLENEIFSVATGKHNIGADNEYTRVELVDFEIDEQSMKQDEETEKQRMVRLGQMTPFGTTIASNVHVEKLKEGTLVGFDECIQSLTDIPKRKDKHSCKNQDSSKSCKFNLNKPGPSNLNSYFMLNENVRSTEKVKKSSLLKKNVLKPIKRRRLTTLGTTTDCNPIVQRIKPGPLPSEMCAINFESSGSEYVPSENEESSDEEKCKMALIRRKRTKCKKKTFDDWGTDDSDWEYSDQETAKHKRKRSKKVIDDGNREDYLERLKIWERERKGKRKGDNESDIGDFQELDGGLKIPCKIWNKLFSYQKVGVQWMWELHQQKCGGILGDEMGLGKTIQVIAFFAALASSSHLSHLTCWRKGLGPSLIVCPTTMLHQWVEEFHSWWPPLRVAILHDSGSFSGRGGKAALVKCVHGSAGILVTSYEGLSRLADDLSLLDWHFVVLDEGHIIRNPDARVTLAAKRLRTPHRLLLSGSPLQNNLRELWSLFDFIYPGKLGTLPIFTAEFAIPITQGGYATASQVQVVTGYKCATVLKDTIAPYLLRRMKADVKDHINLPSKNEQVLFCRLTDEQREVYREYLKSGDVDRILTGTLKVFVGLINLRKICNHPHLYTGGPKLFKWDTEEKLAEEERYGYWKKSGKMIVVENLLRIWHRQGHRVLLFTQGRQMMCILENFVSQQGYSYLKLDGSTSISARQPLINKFNQDNFYFIFLLTTKVGGIGVNLTGANRVLIYDPDWNPATDTQARERAWRPGQLRHVTVYRLVTAGTIEEKIYHRQIFKQFLTDRVLRDPSRRRFFKSNDLYELFTLNEGGDDSGKRGAKTETSAIFAGTGSEITITIPKPKSKRNIATKEKKEKKVDQNIIISNVKVRMSEESNYLTNMRKNTITKVNETNNIDNPVTCSLITIAAEKSMQGGNNVAFSKEKIEMMKKMAQNLSLKISKQLREGERIVEEKDESSLSHLNEAEDPSELPANSVSTKCSQVLHEKRNVGREQNTDSNLKNIKRIKNHSRNSKKRHSSKKGKGCMFEGEQIANLVACEKASSKTKKSEQTKEHDKEVSQSQDDYVLKKLFAKSALQTALHHDVIMEGGGADYALVEGEAERVAHEAVKALKESRRNCWAASTGVPTWTGHNGMLCQNVPSSCAVKPKLLRFGNKKRQPSEARISGKISSVPAADAEQNSLSSSELLLHIRSKDSLLEYFRWKKRMKDLQQNGNDNRSIEDEQYLGSSGVTREQADLLDDIRGFVACGAGQDGQATTQEILTRFKERLPQGATPQLFKSLLKAVCNFESHGITGFGLWKLKPEFCD